MAYPSTIESVIEHADDLTLQWNHLSFCTQRNGNDKRKQILKDVSGSAKSNSFTAIMGPSGAGKTFLLESIAQKLEGIAGSVTLNNVLLNRNVMSDISGYLLQQDTVTDFLTASEYLQFICTMKLGSTYNKHNRNIHIKKICADFYMNKSLNTRIRNLSGGERKQLLLAAEMLSDPLILLCDEPTTGLDGYNALNVVQILKQMSLRKKIVIITVHQPSVDIIQYFNNIILLSQGVKVLEGTSDEISTFFSNLNILCPVSCSIAEFYVRQISVIPGNETECMAKIDSIRKSFLESQSATDSHEKLEILQYNKK
ncbi:white [Carabus blaptoides fortunei]